MRSSPSCCAEPNTRSGSLRPTLRKSHLKKKVAFLVILLPTKVFNQCSSDYSVVPVSATSAVHGAKRLKQTILMGQAQERRVAIYCHVVNQIDHLMCPLEQDNWLDVPSLRLLQVTGRVELKAQRDPLCAFLITVIIWWMPLGASSRNPCHRYWLWPFAGRHRIVLLQDDIVGVACAPALTGTRIRPFTPWKRCPSSNLGECISKGTKLATPIGVEFILDYESLHS